MRATEEAAFWLYSAKDWIDGMNAFVPDRLISIVSTRVSS